jgi:preprotein translocase subunit SecF
MKIFNIIEKKNLWLMLSGFILLISAFGIINKYSSGQPLMNMGIDFTGGTSIIIRFDKLDDINAIEDKSEKDNKKMEFLTGVRQTLKKFKLEKSLVQFSSGKDLKSSDLSIKTIPLANETREGLIKSLEDVYGELELMESDVIGPSIGEELALQSVKIILLAVVLLLIYITIRFEIAYAIAAIFALLHDALITIGIAGLLNIEINTAFVAAILTILGYSINDTIVIFDRVRENVPKLVKKNPLSYIVNVSIRQSLARSINTSVTTLIVLLSIFIFGGATVKNFSLVLMIGIVSGTYSSVFIASPLFVQLKKRFGE